MSFINRFKSNYFETGYGFQLEYESSNFLKWSYSRGACGGNFANPNGLLTSPSYPDKYPNGADCFYTILQPNDTVITLTFFTLDMESHHFCSYDYLEIRDGPSIDSPLLQTICGNIIPETIHSRQNKVWMK